MARAWSPGSIWVFMNGAVGSGILPPENPTPILQPHNENGQGFPQIVSFLPTSNEVDEFDALQIEAFHVENEIPPGQYCNTNGYDEWREG